MVPHRVATLMFAASVALGTVTVTAQVPLITATLDSGTLVRLHPRVGPVVIGRLTQRFAAASDSLVACRYPGPPCRAAGDSVAVRHYAVAGLTALDVQRGNHLASGALGGGLLGALLGGLAALANDGLCGDSAECPPGWHFTAIGTLSGVILGGLFGLASPTWRPASEPRVPGQ